MAGLITTPALRPVILNHVQSPVQVPADFVMNTDAIGARFDEDRRVGVRIFNHQMVIEFQRVNLRRDSVIGSSHGEVRNEMAVHDVDMDHAGAGLLDGRALPRPGG